MQSWIKEFTMGLLNAYFLMSSLLRFFELFIWMSSSTTTLNFEKKNNNLSTLSIPFMILKVYIKSLLTLLVVRRDNPKLSS